MMRRLAWLTKHPLQSKYLFIVLMSMLLPTIVLASCIYFLIFTMMAEQFVLPEAIHTMLVPVFYKINLVLMVSMPLMFIAVFFWGLYVSHRFAGPIERIETDLDNVLTGKSQDPINIRSRDDLAGVVARINRILAERPGR